MTTTKAKSPVVKLNNGIFDAVIRPRGVSGPPEQNVGAVESAIANGYRMIDTAAAYVNERQVGEGIVRSGSDRAEIFVQTKLWTSDCGYDRTLGAFDVIRNPLAHPVVPSLVTQYAKTPAQIVLHWHIEHGLSTIPKSVRPERTSENIDIFDFQLTADEVASIDALDTGKRRGPDPGLVNPQMLDIKIPD